MDDAKAGAAALEAKDHETAIRYYTKALTTHPQAVDYYIKRSMAYTRLSPPNYLLALFDAETAVVLAHKRGKRELIAQAQLRRGIALFKSERYGDAQKCMEWAAQLAEKDNLIGIWKEKARVKVEELDEGDERLVAKVEEKPNIDMDSLANKAKQDHAKNVAATGAKDEKPASSAGAESSGKPAAAAESPAPPAPYKVRHDWYQSADSVTLTILAKGVPAEKTEVELQPNSVSVSFPLPTGSDFDLSLDPLFGEIDPAESSYKVMKTKIELVLKKRAKGQKWHALEGSSDAPVVTSTDATASSDANKPEANAAAGPNYPTSSKSGPKDWDKVAAELTARPKKDKEGKEGDAHEHEGDDDAEYDSDSGGDPVNAFFKKLYANADPDTRRAMMKSYQESNGTALSTNWSEVGAKPVETVPPEGMVAKKWES